MRGGIPSLGSYRAGAGLCSPYMYHVESTHVTHSPEQLLPNWYVHYGKYLFKHKGHDIPRPVMFKKKPCWSGSLFPFGRNTEEEGHIWVCDFDLRYAQVKITDIREPTDAEYEKHYKKVIEENTYFIKTSSKYQTAKVIKK